MPKFFQNKVLMLIIMVFFLVLIGVEGIYYLTQDRKAEPIREDMSEQIETPEVKKMVSIDLKGAVASPGVYALEDGSTLGDLISQNSLNADAELKNINLSMLLTDGLVIEIPLKKKETTIANVTKTSTSAKTNTTVTSESSSSGNKVTIKSSKKKLETPETSDNEPLIININTAGVDELTKLNGIGEAKAQAIIDYRNSNGAFEAIADILNVKGIGESIYAKIKDFITV